jgi:hypothetical protein
LTAAGFRRPGLGGGRFGDDGWAAVGSARRRGAGLCGRFWRRRVGRRQIAYGNGRLGGDRYGDGRPGGGKEVR